MKRAQVTVFVIVGVVLLVLVGLFFLFQENVVQSTQEEPDTSQSSDPFVVFMNGCMQDALYQSPYYVASTIFFSKDKSLATRGMPYFYFQSRNTLPKKDVLEKEYANFLKQEILPCIDSFSALQETLNGELILEEDYLEVQVLLAEEKVTAKTLITGYVVGDSKQTPIPSSIISQETSLGQLYHLAELTVDVDATRPFPQNEITTYLAENSLFGVADLGPIPGTVQFTYADFSEVDNPLQISFLVNP